MVTENRDGSLTFRIYTPHADMVVIHGDFTPPEGTPMQRRANGWWEATLRVPPGDHTFRYIINGHASIPDYAASGLALDEHGAWVSCLCVAPPRSAEPAEVEPRLLVITDAQIRLLAAGRRVELRAEGAGGAEERPVVLVRSPRPEDAPRGAAASPDPGAERGSGGPQPVRRSGGARARPVGSIRSKDKRRR